MPNRDKKATRLEVAAPLPAWNPSTKNLKWRGHLILHLAPQAYAERAIVNAFEERNWQFVVKNPVGREEIGDATASRRHAIYNLVRKQGERRVIQFFSAGDGYVAWCPAEWLGD